MITDETKLTDSAAIYNSLQKMLWEKRVDASNWPNYSEKAMRDTIKHLWRSMTLLIPTSHYEAVESIMKQNNIVHYGNS